MTHDPLCDWWEKQCEITECDGQRPYSDICKHDYCQCILIAKVRDDCLEKVRGAFIVGTDRKVITPSHPEYSHDGTEIWNSAINTAIAYMTGATD